MSKRVNQKLRSSQKRRKLYNKRKSAVSLAKQMGFIMFMLTMLFIFQPTKASAATIFPAAGDFMINSDDGICQLEEALNNINLGSRNYADCEEVGDYGVNDTIMLPNGTIEDLSGSGSFYLNKSINMIGQDQSVVKDYDLSFSGDGSNVLLQNLTIMNGSIEGSGIGALSLEGVEVDGQGKGDIGIYVPSFSHANIQDSYIHSFSGSGGVWFGSDGRHSRSINIERTTFSNMAIGVYISAYAGSSGDTEMDVNIENSTFNVYGAESYDGSGLMNFGISAEAFSDYEDYGGVINYTLTNNTFSNGLPGTYMVAVSEVSVGVSSEINLTAQNNLFALGDGENSINYSRIEMDGGNVSSHSLGGNFSSDNSLSSYLNQPTDKHNQPTLAQFLGELDDNGGPVPTMALLEGSPAIDGGTTVTGMTTDARGQARPQGSAFDVGAYESAFGGDDDDDDNQPNPGQVMVTTPGGNNGNNGDTVTVVGTPTIAVRPTFSGVATPNSTIIVTVNSDPVICTTTSDNDGNWSCTLGEDLEPGLHTVTVEVRDPDTNELINTFGPYAVNVPDNGTVTIDSNTQPNSLANTGYNAAMPLVASGILLSLVSAVMLKANQFKKRVRYIFNR